MKLCVSKAVKTHHYWSFKECNLGKNKFGNQRCNVEKKWEYVRQALKCTSGCHREN